RAKLSAAPADNTTWFQLPITVLASGGVVPGNNNPLLVTFHYGGAGGGGGVSAVGTYASQPPSANAAVISGSSIYFQNASLSNPGMFGTAFAEVHGKKFCSNISVGQPVGTSNQGLWLDGNAALLPQIDPATADSTIDYKGYIAIGTSNV